MSHAALYMAAIEADVHLFDEFLGLPYNINEMVISSKNGNWRICHISRLNIDNFFHFTAEEVLCENQSFVEKLEEVREFKMGINTLQARINQFIKETEQALALAFESKIKPIK